MTLIVDASVALKWYLADEPDAADARALLQIGEPLAAPDIVIADTCNAAWRGVRVGRLAPAQAIEIAGSLPALYNSLVGCVALAERATAIAIALDHAVYDCFYLALAETAKARLITADARLLAKLKGTQWQATTLSLSQYTPPN